MKLHIAKAGDTISALAVRYGIEPERILAANPGLADADALTKGAKVKIPSGSVAMIAARTEAAAAAPGPEDGASVAPAAYAELPASVPDAAATANEASAANANEANEALAPYANAANEALTANEASANAANEALAPYAPNDAVPTAYWSGPNEAFLPGANAPNEAFLSGAASPFANAATTYPFAGVEPLAYTSGLPNAEPSLPAHYKTELPAANQSPLHTKWSGMQDGLAVPPYAPFPTPAVPAGAPLSAAFPPFGFDPSFAPPAPPFPPLGAFPQAYGAMPEPYPGAFPGAAPGAPISRGGCGCGKGTPGYRLPYAFPDRSAPSQADDEARAAAAAEPLSRATTEPEGDAVRYATGRPEPKRKPPEARVSSRNDRLRTFLKKAATVRKTPKRGSKPWIVD